MVAARFSFDVFGSGQNLESGATTRLVNEHAEDSTNSLII